MSHILMDVHMLEFEIERLRTEYPELAEDERLRADTIEGETDAHTILDRIVSQIIEAKTLEEAQAARLGELKARKEATARRQEAMRKLALRIMKAADLPKVKLTEKTLGITKGRESVEIYDETALPKWAFNVEVVSKPSKTAIGDAFKVGQEVPGARLVVGDDTLRVA